MQLPDPSSTRHPGPAPYLRIATEEAFAPPEMLEIYRSILKGPNVDPGFRGLMGFYMSSPSERAQHAGAQAGRRGSSAPHDPPAATCQA